MRLEALGSWVVGGLVAFGLTACCSDGVDAVWTSTWQMGDARYDEVEGFAHQTCGQSDADEVAILGMLYRAKIKACRAHCTQAGSEACLYRCDRGIRLVTRTCEARMRPGKGIPIPVR